jgi:hypothetical protein
MWGHGIGAWASARSVEVLVPDSGTLIVTQAAPLHRDPFLRGDGADAHRDFTPDEDRAWRQAQQKIAEPGNTAWGSCRCRITRPSSSAPLTPHPALRTALDTWT